MPALVYVGLGSNSGDSERVLRSACVGLAEFLRGFRVSSVWRSAPRYVLDQPDFLNAVASGECALEPPELLRRCNALEAALGRDRSRERLKGPRTLDLDILLYGRELLDLPDLIVPHPGMKERAFVLRPLLELEPDLADPRSGLRFADFLPAVEAQGIYPAGLAALY